MRRRAPISALLGLLLITAAIYAPAMHGGPVWDDDAHLTSAALRGSDGLRRIWFDVDATQQYYPVVHSAFWVMDRLWGSNPPGYHLVNIVLHALIAWCVGCLLTRLKVPGAWIAATLFAVHPVHVESVAWMTELKNTLSGAFGLGAVLVYLTFDESRRPRAYLTALVLFVLALLSKSVTATLGPALLVIIWWQRGRIDWRRDALPLIPFVALGVASGLATSWIEHHVIGAHGSEFQLSTVERMLIAGRAIVFYLGTLAWPAHLAFIYPRWKIDAAVLWQYAFPLAVIAMLIVAWLVRARSRTPLAVLLLFIGLLTPALGFVNVYPFRYAFVANHFDYLASLPVLAATGAGLALAGERWKSPAVWLLSLLIVAPLSWICWQDAHQYTDAVTLYRSTLARNPDCPLCYTNLADLNLKSAQPDVQAAVQDLQSALRLNSVNPEAHNSLGLAWQLLGRLDDAIAEHQEALRQNPEFALAAYNLAFDLQLAGRLQDSAAWYQRSLEMVPDSGKAHNNLGNVLMGLGRMDEAVAHLEEGRRLLPNSPEVLQNLGNVLLRSGRFNEAATVYADAIQLKPDVAELHNNRGIALRQLGRLDEAIAEFQECIRLMPDAQQARTNLAAALAAKGKL